MAYKSIKRSTAYFLTLLHFTLLTGCAAVPFFSTLSSIDDPVERVGLEQRRDHQERPPISTTQATQDNGEITLGMSMEDVIRLWGNPGSVDHAGDQPTLNERWTYIQGLISESQIAPVRIVYFEKGRVSGWKISPQ
jgi:hypothetical protein